jgi:hypothetical protein
LQTLEYRIELRTASSEAGSPPEKLERREEAIRRRGENLRELLDRRAELAPTEEEQARVKKGGLLAFPALALVGFGLGRLLYLLSHVAFKVIHSVPDPGLTPRLVLEVAAYVLGAVAVVGLVTGGILWALIIAAIPVSQILERLERSNEFLPPAIMLGFCTTILAAFYNA